MPHVAFVPFTGFRVRDAELAALGQRRPELRTRAAAIGRLPALGLLTLAGAAPRDWSMAYHEADGDDADLVERVAAEHPTLVAISALTAAVDQAYRFADAARARGLRVVLGGLHATACPDEAQLHADAVVVGEGEPVWPAVLADARAGRLAPRYRAAAPFDLAAAPIPRFDLLGDRPRPRLTLQTQRGCPLACEFCAASRLLGPFREKPLASIGAELAALTAVAPRPLLELADDNTFAGGRAPAPLLDTLRAAGARWFTEVDWRIGERPEVLRDLAAAGCVQALVGIESLVATPGGMGPKRAPLARIFDAVRAIQAAGVCVIGCFIAGADGETRSSLDALVRTIDDSPCADVQVTLQTPFPGTALRARLARAGRLLLDRGWSHCTLFDVAFVPDRMTVADLEAGFRAVLRAVFAPGPAARRAAVRRAVWRRNPALRPCNSAR